MPLDTNIALGVRPIEQPNMLGQMAQAMQIRQAQQGFEEQNALRNFYAQGGDVSTPKGRQQLMSTSPAAGIKLIGAQSEINARDVGTAEKTIGLFKNQIGNVNDHDSALRWASALYDNPVTGPLMQSMAPKEQALSAIPSDPAGLEAWKRKAGLTADKLFEDANSIAANKARIQAAGISAGPAYARLAMEQKQQAEIDALFGKPPTTTTAPMGGGGGVPNALPATVGATPAAPVSTNMLVPGAQTPTAAPVAATAPGDVYAQIQALDAKIAPLVNTGNPRASAIVQQLIAQRNALMQSAKQQYGGTLVDMEVTDPKTGLRTVVKGREDQYGRLVPVEMAPVPLSTDASATGGTGISSTVARPAPSAAAVKERQVAEKLPEAIAMNTDAIRKIDELIGSENGKVNPHPGLSKATGLGGGVMRFFSGTEGKNFEIRHKEVLSQAFLDAFEALKGGGAITEKEGEKATSARTRMDLAQSKEEYMTAAREYQGVLKRGVENARARMQRSGTTPPAGAPEDPLGIR
jgi:hypothetical protein